MAKPAIPHQPASRPRTPRQRFGLTAAVAVGITLWAAAIVVPPFILLRFRPVWLAALDSPQAQADWDEFRDAMRQQSGRQGPVQHKVPKSVEPPMRVWLRDHTWLAISAWVMLGGTLGLCAVLMAVGALARGGPRTSAAEDQPGGAGDGEEQHQRDAENPDKGRHGVGSGEVARRKH